MIEAVIFDMDGLLFDTESLSTDLLIEAAKLQGVDMSVDETKLVLGFTSEAIYDFYDNYYKDVEGVDGRKIVEDHYKMLEDVLFSTGPAKMPKLDETLSYLKEKGYKTAVASSSDMEHIINNLEKTNTKGYFDVIASGQEVENGKPEPDVFLLAAERLGVDQKNCIVLEDSKYGIQAAKKAEMTPIMVPDSYYPDEDTKKLTYAVIENLFGVVDILEKLNS